MELSARPSLVVAAAPERGDLTKLSVMSVHDISAGETVRGYVQEVTADCAWLVLSPSLRGRLHALDAADDVERLSGFSERFRPGQALRCKVSQVSHFSAQSLCIQLSGKLPKYCNNTDYHTP